MNSTIPGGGHRAHTTTAAVFRSALISATTAAVAISSVPALPATPTESAESTNKLMIVDCLLPGQLRKLGAGATFLSARQPVKTSAADCEIRGGEYVAYDRANYGTALKIWLPLANGGDKQAQTYVGEIFEKGLGITPDYQAAATWYRRAADQGYSRALVNLGFLYEKGLGVPKDAGAALKLYRRAAGIEGAIALDDDSGGATQRLAEEVSSLQRLLAEPRRSLDTANADRAKAEAARDSLARDRTEAARRNDTTGVNLFEARLAEREKELREQRGELQRLQRQAQRLSDELERTQAARSQQAEASNAALSGRDGEVATLRAQLEAAQRDLERARSDSDAADRARAVISKQHEQAARQQDQGRMSRLDAEIKARIEEANTSRAQVARLEQEMAKFQTALASLEASRKSESQSAAAALNARDLEIRRRDEEIAKLSRELTELRGYRVDLEAERRRLEESRRALLVEKDAAIKANEQHRLNLVEGQLKDREGELERRRDQAQRLEKELERSREIIAKFESDASRGGEASGAASLAVPLAPPSIQLIDPQLVASRGSTLTVSLQPGVKARDLIGRVVAAAGLMSLTVNDHRQPVEENGLFKTSIDVQPGQTPVQIVAVDRQGQRVTSQFLMSSGDALATARPVAKPPTRPIAFGSYYALVIGNEKYQKVARLETAVADATEVGRLLESKFGFKTAVLLNATRYQILTELNRLRASLTEKDNLVIYYAGHGELDRANLRAHWLPIDAEPDSDANWISTAAVTDILNAMSVKHVLVVADSCYSGAMTRSSIGRLDTGMSDEARVNWLKAIASARSRTVMTSGGVQPVADGGGGKHSVFAKSFIEVLNAVSDVIEAQRLYHEISARVLNAALKFKFEQRPEYAPMRFAGHESGDFLFVPRN